MAAWNELPADGGSSSECDALVDVADRLRWSAPELTVQFAARVLGVATADQAARTRAHALLAAALVSLGRHAEAVEPGLAALRAATAGGQIERAARMRIALAACARALGEPLTGCEILRPVLQTKTAEPATRAFALGQLVSCAAHVGSRDDLEDALAEADRLLASDENLTQDARRVESALLNVRAASYHRRHGDTEAAADTARAGLTLVNRLHDTAAEGGRVRARLILELVCAILDDGDLDEAVRAAEPALTDPARAASAPALGRLRLALATRVHIPAGRTDIGRALLAEVVQLAERHRLDSLLTDAWTFLAHADEEFNRPTDALHALRSARAAEHRHLRAVEQSRQHLGAEFGLEQRPERAIAQLRGIVRAGAPARTAVRLPDQSLRRIATENAHGAPPHSRRDSTGTPRDSILLGHSTQGPRESTPAGRGSTQRPRDSAEAWLDSTPSGEDTANARPDSSETPRTSARHDSTRTRRDSTQAGSDSTSTWPEATQTPRDSIQARHDTAQTRADSARADSAQAPPDSLEAPQVPRDSIETRGESAQAGHDTDEGWPGLSEVPHDSAQARRDSASREASAQARRTAAHTWPDSIELHRDPTQARHDSRQTRRDSAQTRHDSLETRRDSTQARHGSAQPGGESAQHDSAQTGEDSAPVQHESTLTRRASAQAGREVVQTGGESARARHDSTLMWRDSAQARRDLAQSEAESAQAGRDAVQTGGESARARHDSTLTWRDSTQAPRDLTQTRGESAQAGREVVQSGADSGQARHDSTLTRRDSTHAQAESAQAGRDAVQAGGELARARHDSTVMRRESAQAGRDSAQAESAQAGRDAVQIGGESAQARHDSTLTRRDSTQARHDSTRARRDGSQSVRDSIQIVRDSTQVRRGGTFAVALVRVAPVGVAHPVDPAEPSVPVGGDVALNALASHVRDLAPPAAELLRTDLGEFAVLLPRTSHVEAQRLATTIRDRAIESAWLVDDQGRDLTIRIGVAVQPAAGDSPRDGVDALLAAARAALLPAPATGADMSSHERALQDRVSQLADTVLGRTSGGEHWAAAADGSADDSSTAEPVTSGKPHAGEGISGAGPTGRPAESGDEMIPMPQFADSDSAIAELYRALIGNQEPPSAADAGTSPGTPGAADRQAPVDGGVDRASASGDRRSSAGDSDLPLSGDGADRVADSSADERTGLADLPLFGGDRPAQADRAPGAGDRYLVDDEMGSAVDADRPSSGGARRAGEQSPAAAGQADRMADLASALSDLLAGQSAWAQSQSADARDESSTEQAPGRLDQSADVVDPTPTSDAQALLSRFGIEPGGGGRRRAPDDDLSMDPLMPAPSAFPGTFGPPTPLADNTIPVVPDPDDVPEPPAPPDIPTPPKPEPFPTGPKPEPQPGAVPPADPDIDPLPTAASMLARLSALVATGIDIAPDFAHPDSASVGTTANPQDASPDSTLADMILRLTGPLQRDADQARHATAATASGQTENADEPQAIASFPAPGLASGAAFAAEAAGAANSDRDPAGPEPAAGPAPGVDAAAHPAAPIDASAEPGALRSGRRDTVPADPSPTAPHPAAVAGSTHSDHADASSAAAHPDSTVAATASAAADSDHTSAAARIAAAAAGTAHSESAPADSAAEIASYATTDHPGTALIPAATADSPAGLTATDPSAPDPADSPSEATDTTVDEPIPLPGPARSAAAAAWLRRTGRPVHEGEDRKREDRKLTAVDGSLRPSRRRERAGGIADLLAEAMVAYQETQPPRNLDAEGAWAADARPADVEPDDRARKAPEVEQRDAGAVNPHGRHRSSEWAPADIDHG